MEKVLKTPPKKKSKKKIVILTISILLGLATISTGIFYYLDNKKEDDKDKKEEEKEESTQNYKVVSDTSSRFAEYKEISVNVDPKLKYTVEKGLTNITNKSDFDLSKEATDKFESNSFVVAPGWSKEFYPLYEDNRYNYTPSFITTDAVLHNYHLLFEYLLERTEKEKLIPELENLNGLMLKDAQSHYEKVKGTDWENAALRNMGFFTVGGKLLDDSISIPEEISEEVKAELSLIEKHEGITLSPLMNKGVDTNEIEGLKEDYTQYIPRGHYDRTEKMRQYFKSMMWYGRITFRFKEDDEIKSAMLMTLALNQGKNKSSWDKIYEPTNFFVGKSDDITFYEMIELIKQVYGEHVTIDDFVKNQSKFEEFKKALDEIEPPKINSIPIFNAEIQPDRDRKILGFRFMGQRYTIDADVFQRLIYREVGGNAEGENRMLPKGLDIPSAMGSEEAYNILDIAGETEYENYKENLEKMQKYITDLDEDVWTQNLYWGWMNSLGTLTEGERAEGYPLFMQNQAWVRKDLNTYLGSWTELKHDTILYAKQVYAEMGGAGGPKKRDDRGYVEPNPWLFARVASLLKMTEDGLKSRDLLTNDMEEQLSTMHELVVDLKEIAEKELNDEEITEDDYELIRSFGGQIEHLWMAVNEERAEEAGIPFSQFLDENPAALVADVATDPNGQVLEEGTGNIYEIFVVVPVDGKSRIAKGGVYSHYEFAWPMNDRLTDKKWREMLNSQKEPEMEAWKKSYMVDDFIQVKVDYEEY